MSSVSSVDDLLETDLELQQIYGIELDTPESMKNTAPSTRIGTENGGAISLAQSEIGDITDNSIDFEPSIAEETNNNESISVTLSIAP